MVTKESPLKQLFRPEEVELLVCGSKVRFDFAPAPPPHPPLVCSVLQVTSRTPRGSQQSNCCKISSYFPRYMIIYMRPFRCVILYTAIQLSLSQSKAEKSNISTKGLLGIATKLMALAIPSRPFAFVFGTSL